MKKDPFKEYIIQVEASKKDKGYAWQTSIGLQKVDGLNTSDYLKELAIKNIEGQICIDEVHALIESYYNENPIVGTDDRTEEADKVATRIAQILSETAFTFSVSEYI